METRNAGSDPIVTQCNVCGQGEYVEINQTELETIAEPVYQMESEPMIEEPSQDSE
jgi:hypothetical protein